VSDRGKRKPVPISDALTGFLQSQGLAKRVEQVSAIDDWPKAVGSQIAQVTRPLTITPDGILFVAVRNHGWMTELSLMEPELLAALNSVEGREKIRKIRFRLDG
jgi:predicted nucleic acid-binding Zn ribbon protein